MEGQSNSAATVVACLAGGRQNGRLKRRQVRNSAIALVVGGATALVTWFWGWFVIGGIAGLIVFGAISARGKEAATGGGSALLVIAVLHVSFIRDSPVIGYYVLLALAALAVAIPLILLLNAIFNRGRRLTCASSGGVHTIFASNSRSLCPECGMLMVSGLNHSASIVQAACYYCGLSTAVAADVGTFLCSNCGVTKIDAVGNPPRLDPHQSHTKRRRY